MLRHLERSVTLGEPTSHTFPGHSHISRIKSNGLNAWAATRSQVPVPIRDRVMLRLPEWVEMLKKPTSNSEGKNHLESWTGRMRSQTLSFGEAHEF